MKVTNTEPAKVESPAPGNVSLADFAARRASRRAAPSDAAATGTPEQTPSETESDNAPDPGAEESSTETDFTEGQTPAEEGMEVAAESGDQTEQETETEQAPAARLDSLLAEAIQAAGVAPDRATAVKDMARRIATIAAERDEERSKRVELETKLQAQPANAGAQELGPDDELVAMDRRLAELDHALVVIESNPDSYTFKTPDGKEVELGPEELRSLKVKYMRDAAALTAKRETYATQLEQTRKAERAQADQLALQNYPWLAKRDAPETQVAIRELAGLPRHVRDAIKALPGYNLFIARYTRGLMLEQQAKPAAPAVPMRKPASNGQRATPVVAGPAAKPKVSPVQTQLAQAEAKLRKTGSAADYAQVRALRRQIKSAA